MFLPQWFDESPISDHSKWTPMSHIAEMFAKWSEDAASRFPNGSLVKIETNDNKTEEVVV